MFSPKPSEIIILSWGNRWPKQGEIGKKEKKKEKHQKMSIFFSFSGFQFLVCDGPRFAWCTSKSLQWILVLTGFALSVHCQELPCGFWPFSKWVRMARSSSQEFSIESSSWRPIHGWLKDVTEIPKAVYVFEWGQVRKRKGETCFQEAIERTPHKEGTIGMHARWSLKLALGITSIWRFFLGMCGKSSHSLARES